MSRTAHLGCYEELCADSPEFRCIFGGWWVARAAERSAAGAELPGTFPLSASSLGVLFKATTRRLPQKSAKHFNILCLSKSRILWSAVRRVDPEFGFRVRRTGTRLIEFEV